MILQVGRWCGKSEECRQAIKLHIIIMIATGQGDSTLMVASHNDPVEKVPKLVWYEEDGITKFDTIWNDRYIHPIKTCYEWAKEYGIEM